MHFLLPFLKRLIRLPYFPIIAAPIVLFSSSLFTGRVLFWGLPALQFIPWRAFAWENLQNGLLPLWNPYNGLGTPLIANYQLALFYPPGWLVYILSALGGTQLMAWGHTVLIVMHLIWAGIGMVAFTKSLGLGELAQTISGLSFTLCGYLVARNSVYSIVWAAAWLPWLLYAANEGLNRSKLTFSFKLLIFTSFQLLTGHAQITWYSLLFAGLWIITLSWSRYGFRRALGAGLLFIFTIIASAGLTAIQLAPTFEFLLQSQRTGAVNYELGLTYSFWPWRLLTFISPDFFGNPGNGTYMGYASYWEDAIYIGVIPFILSISTFTNILTSKKSINSKQRPIMRVLWCLIAVGFVLALGKNTPIFPFLYQFVPTFGMFNAPARWLIWVVFGLCVLAGMGAESWKPPIGKAVRKYRKFAVISVAIAIGAGFTWLTIKDVRPTFIQATFMAALWGLIYCLISLGLPKTELGRQRWNYFIIGLIALDLVAGQWSLIRTIEASLFSPTALGIVLNTDQRVYLSYQDEYNLKFQRFFRIDDFNPVENWGNLWNVLLPNSNLLAKTAYVNNFDPLMPGRYAYFINYLDQLKPGDRTEFLKLINVGYAESIDPTLQAGVRFEPVAGQGRFQWDNCVLFAKDEEESWSLTKEQISNLGKGLIVIEGAGTNSAAPCSPDGKINIQVANTTPQSVSVSIDAEKGGWLLMADTWYPGWIATVDGIPVNIYRADYLLRGIPVEGGQHKVEIQFRPLSMKIGLWVSGFGWVIILIFILIHAIRNYFWNKL
jgi:hypothetical protein